MRFLSLFSGIEAASVAWSPLGWSCVAIAEIEPFPCAVLKHRYPTVPNLGDITKITEADIRLLGHIDLVIMGFPCQDASTAGKGKGLTNADGTLTRTGLFYPALQIAAWSRARWLVGENVPGLFSVSQGRDFASVVGALVGSKIGVPESGWGTAGVALGPLGLCEWATLDAQYVRVESHPRAVPQRRRRVFFVRDSGDWKDRPPVLFEPQSLRRHSPPRRGQGQNASGTLTGSAGSRGGYDDRGCNSGLMPVVSGTLSARTEGGGGLGTDFELGGGLIPEVAGCLGHNKKAAGSATTQDAYSDLLIPEGEVAHTLRGDGFDASEDGTGRGTPLVADTIRSHTRPGSNSVGTIVAEAFGGNNQAGAIDVRNIEIGGDVAFALTAPAGGGRAQERNIATGTAVRRMTPLECERLQGFPDGYTAIPVGKRGTIAKDGPRYKAIGNSFAINCISLIGQRIQAVHDL